MRSFVRARVCWHAGGRLRARAGWRVLARAGARVLARSLAAVRLVVIETSVLCVRSCGRAFAGPCGRVFARSCGRACARVCSLVLPRLPRLLETHSLALCWGKSISIGNLSFVRASRAGCPSAGPLSLLACSSDRARLSAGSFPRAGGRSFVIETSLLCWGKIISRGNLSFVRASRAGRLSTGPPSLLARSSDRARPSAGSFPRAGGRAFVRSFVIETSFLCWGKSISMSTLVLFVRPSAGSFARLLESLSLGRVHASFASFARVLSKHSSTS